MFYNKNLSFMYLGLRLSSNLRVIIFTDWNPPMCIRESRLRNLPIKLKRRVRLRCRWNNKLLGFYKESDKLHCTDRGEDNIRLVLFIPLVYLHLLDINKKVKYNSCKYASNNQYKKNSINRILLNDSSLYPLLFISNQEHKFSNPESLYRTNHLKARTNHK